MERRRSVFYNAGVKSWDVVIVGGGIIGLSLAIALRRRGAHVLVVERGEPGREASYAAGGMLVDCSLETPAALQQLAVASARMYPEFAHEIEVECGAKVDLRDQGTLFIPPAEHVHERPGLTMAELLTAPLSELEPDLRAECALYLMERSVNPRSLSSAAIIAANILAVVF